MMLNRLKNWLFGTGAPDGIISPETGSEDIYTMDLAELLDRVVDGEAVRQFNRGPDGKDGLLRRWTDDEDSVANFDLEQEELD